MKWRCITGKQRLKVGEQAQLTIPPQLRTRFSLAEGDEVLIHEEDGKLVIESPASRKLLVEGYHKRAERNRALANELKRISAEADTHLGDVSRWKE